MEGSCCGAKGSLLESTDFRLRVTWEHFWSNSSILCNQTHSLDNAKPHLFGGGTYFIKGMWTLTCITNPWTPESIKHAAKIKLWKTLMKESQLHPNWTYYKLCYLLVAIPCAAMPCRLNTYSIVSLDQETNLTCMLELKQMTLLVFLFSLIKSLHALLDLHYLLSSP